jgi:hypothetical protein
MARDIRFIVKDLEEATKTAAQSAAVEIMNGLAKAGPAYTGKFSSAWYAVPQGGSAGGPRAANQIYKYDKRNVPKARFVEGTWYEIKNGSSYAAEAMDLVPYTPDQFTRTKTVKKQEFGERAQGGRRGELSGEGRNTSTAPLDWWSRYNAAGNLQADLARGFQRGFGSARGF